jgi:uncharacterized protein (DUF488 family)
LQTSCARIPLEKQISDPIYTIGHGSRPLEELIVLLQDADIGCLVDVRAFPGSRRHPHFGRAELERSLPPAGVAYEWEGGALGGRRRPRPDSPHQALRNAGFRAYADHMETEVFVAGVERLRERAFRARVAVMCAERLPWQCHRYMIADYLVAHGVEVVHIIGEASRRAHELRVEARVVDGRLIYDRKTQASLGLK